jgi:hypothetical protein
MRMNLDVFSVFPWVEPAGRRFDPSTGSSGASSPASTVLSRRYDFLPFVSPHYASQCELPTPHARLVSSRWSDTTGRAFDPQGSNKRFQGAYSISSPFPKLAWRNRIDRSIGEPPCARRCRRPGARKTAPKLSLMELFTFPWQARAVELRAARQVLMKFEPLKSS